MFCFSRPEIFIGQSTFFFFFFITFFFWPIHAVLKYRLDAKIKKKRTQLNSEQPQARPKIARKKKSKNLEIKKGKQKKQKNKKTIESEKCVLWYSKNKVEKKK